MKFYFPQYFESKSRHLTYHVVKIALEKAGHTVTAGIDADTDAMIFSICDVMEYPKLVKAKKAADLGRVPLIVGGAYAFNYWSAILYADAVWIGEVFEMAGCKSMDEIREHSACYTGDDTKQLVSARRIDWDRVPVCQIAPKHAYYWGGVGCKNKCRFCFTSWTHPHEVNSQDRLKQAIAVAKKNKIHLMITSNEYEHNEVAGKTRDMLLVDYIRQPVKGASMIRCGVEFATEQSRALMGKPITDDQIYAALQKRVVDKLGALRFFHISGYDTVADWEAYIRMLAQMLDGQPKAGMLHLMFNNLQYQNYTPLFGDLAQIEPARYISIKETKAWYDVIRSSCGFVLVSPPSPFQHVAARMGIELATTRKAVDYWLAKLNDAAKKLTVSEAYASLVDPEVGVLGCAKRRLNINTGEISVVGR